MEMPYKKFKLLCQITGENYISERLNRLEELMIAIGSSLSGNEKVINRFQNNLVKGIKPKSFKLEPKPKLSISDIEKLI